jgi:hypothetical protein
MRKCFTAIFFTVVILFTGLRVFGASDVKGLTEYKFKDNITWKQAIQKIIDNTDDKDLIKAGKKLLSDWNSTLNGNVLISSGNNDTAQGFNIYRKACMNLLKESNNNDLKWLNSTHPTVSNQINNFIKFYNSSMKALEPTPTPTLAPTPKPITTPVGSSNKFQENKTSDGKTIKQLIQAIISKMPDGQEKSAATMFLDDWEIVLSGKYGWDENNNYLGGLNSSGNAIFDGYREGVMNDFERLNHVYLKDLNSSETGEGSINAKIHSVIAAYVKSYKDYEITPPTSAVTLKPTIKPSVAPTVKPISQPNPTPITVEQKKYTDTDLDTAIDNAEIAEKNRRTAEQYAMFDYYKTDNKFPRTTTSNASGKRPEYDGWFLHYGKLKNGVPDGFCIMYPSLGYEIKNGVRFEKIDYESGNYIKGYWANGKLNGKAMVIDNHIEYTGDFLNGKPEGVITIKYPDKARYTGEIKNGKYNGIGEFQDPDGNRWDGEWMNGCFTGFGVMYDKSNGALYYGKFTDGRLNGFGQMFADNTYLWGDFKDTQFIALLGMYEMTAQEIADRKAALSAAISNVEQMTQRALLGIDLNHSGAELRLQQFRFNLKKSQPPKQYYYVSNCGIDKNKFIYPSNYVYGQ